MKKPHAHWLGQSARRRIASSHSRPERKFLGHGRYRPLRPVQRNSLRHGPDRFRRRPRRLHISLRLRPLRGNLESRFHAVQSRFHRRAESASQAVASIPAWASNASPPCSKARSATYDTDLFQPLMSEAARHCAASMRERSAVPSFAANRRGPLSRGHFSDFRWSDSLERRPRLRSAKNYSPRLAPRANAQRCRRPFLSFMAEPCSRN